MTAKRYPYYLAGQPAAPNHRLAVTDKYSGEVFAEVASAGPAEIEQAIAACAAAAPAMAALCAYERRDILQRCVTEITARSEEFARVLCREAGKPIKDARTEVGRMIDTFQIAAEEALRIGGAVIDLDIAPRARGYRGLWKRVPIGPCSFITPFNFPLNLAAHKVAPAIAMGNPFVLKPAERTPVSAILLGEVLAAAGLPDGAFSVVPCDIADAGPFTTDERLKLLSFTGSRPVGWKLKAQAGAKKVVLELGGNAACIVERDADIADAVERIVYGGFYQSGQTCISVQRVMVHEAIYDELLGRLVARVKELKVGDPNDEETFIGPVISINDAVRLEQWVQDAAAAGAQILTGGTRDGVMMQPTVIAGAPPGCKVNDEEAFGPLVNVTRFADFKQAVAAANASRYGLQVGVFTRDIYQIQYAFDHLEAGGIIINDVSSFRVDNMPYGGIKDSGTGREGVRFAMEDMSEIKLLVLRNPGS